MSVPLTIELTGTRQRKPGLQMSGHGAVQHRTLGMPWAVELGFGRRRREGLRIGVGARMPIRLGWGAGVGNWHGAVPARAEIARTGWVAQYGALTSSDAPPDRGMPLQQHKSNSRHQQKSYEHCEGRVQPSMRALTGAMWPSWRLANAVTSLGSLMPATDQDRRKRLSTAARWAPLAQGSGGAG